MLKPIILKNKARRRTFERVPKIIPNVDAFAIFEGQRLLLERFCGLSLEGAVSINSNGRAFFLSSF